MQLFKILFCLTILLHSPHLMGFSYPFKNKPAFAGYTKGKPRDYFEPLSQQDRTDIYYILRTLANSTLIKIGGQKSSLKRAGDRIEHIHPLKFLQFVFSEEELKVCMRNVQGRSWVWKEFLEGLTTSLKNEASLNNISMQYVTDLAKKINVDVNLILPWIQNRRWEDLVNGLIQYVPRQSGPNRYDG